MYKHLHILSKLDLLVTFLNWDYLSSVHILNGLNYDLRSPSFPRVGLHLNKLKMSQSQAKLNGFSLRSLPLIIMISQHGYWIMNFLWNR